MLKQNMVAAGAYIARLRDERGMNQEALGQLLNTSQKQISRWELGEHRPIGPKLNDLVKAVQGDINDVVALMSNPDATAEDGIHAAEIYLKRHPKDQEAIARFFNRQPPCQVCGEVTWHVGATIASPIIDPATLKPALFGPMRVMLQIVCRTCGNVLLFDTGEVPAMSAEVEPDSETVQ